MPEEWNGTESHEQALEIAKEKGEEASILGYPFGPYWTFEKFSSSYAQATSEKVRSSSRQSLKSHYPVFKAWAGKASEGGILYFYTADRPDIENRTRAYWFEKNPDQEFAELEIFAAHIRRTDRREEQRPFPGPERRQKPHVYS